MAKSQLVANCYCSETENKALGMNTWTVCFIPPWNSSGSATNCSSHPQLPKRMNWVPVSAHSTWSAASVNIFQRLYTVESICLHRNCYLGTVRAWSVFQKSSVCRSMEAPANVCEGRELVKGGIVFNSKGDNSHLLVIICGRSSWDKEQVFVWYLCSSQHSGVLIHDTERRALPSFK